MLLYTIDVETNNTCRLRTRMAYVQNEERQLDRKRQKRKSCISLGYSTAQADAFIVDEEVVEAFQTALALLAGLDS